MANTIVKSSFSRVWLAENGVSPARDIEYYGRFKIGDPSQSFGDIESIEEPDPNGFDRFVAVDFIRGETERPSASLTARYQFTQSKLLRIARTGCTVDIQVHIGACRNPQLYNESWDKILVFEEAIFTNFSIEGLGAIDSSERAATNEAVDFSAADMYEVNKLNIAEVTSNANEEIAFVAVYGSRECADCDDTNLVGCETVVAVSNVVGITNPDLIYSTDGMATRSTDAVGTMANNPSGLAIAGEYVIVLDNTAGEFWYINLEELVLGTGAWANVSAGFSDNPVGIASTSPQDTWIIGDTGYVYKLVNLVVSEATEVAAATALVDISMFDADNIIVATAANVYYTTNGGDTWTQDTGATDYTGGGNSVTAVHMIDSTTWLVAVTTGTAASLFYTINSGSNYYALSLPTALYTINDIAFATPSVGFLVGETATAGRLLRTTDAGRSWKVLPDKVAALPTSASLDSVAVCPRDPNTVYVGGEGSSSDSVILVGEA